MHALIHRMAAPGRSRRRWSLVVSIAIALSFAPRLLLAESITVEQGAQVTRPTAVTVSAGEAITVRDLSRLDLQNSLTVAGGTVRVESTGRLNTATLAGQTVLKGGSAHATVDGGSIWNAGGLFRIGESGEARLTISNGGHVHSGFNGSSTDIGIPFTPSDQPTASTLVTGAGSLWDVRSQLRMGRGEFSILDGGLVNVEADVQFGVPRYEGPVKVVVSGPGSIWSIRTDWNMIYTPHEIIVEDGATIRSGVIAGRTHFSGPLSGPRGSATIRGAQTRWETFGFAPTRTDVLISDGASLTARYAVFDSATLSIRDRATVSVADYMTVGGNPRSTLEVFGPDSKLDVANYFTVEGATIRVESGAKLNTNKQTGDSRLAGGNAQAIVDGPGSMWTVGGSMEVGGAGESHLSISNGGIIESGFRGNRTRISGAGGPLVGGSSATVTGIGSKWIVNSGLEIGDSGEAHLFVRDGAYVTSGLNRDRTRIAGAAQPAEAPSSATVTGPNSVWEILGDFSVATNGNGSLSILDGGRVTSGTGGFTQLSGSANRPGFATIDGANSVWAIRGSFQMGDGQPVFTRVANGGLLSVQTTLTGARESILELDGGRVEAAQIVTEGEIRGSGTIVADVTSRNKTVVGSSAGLLTINGDFIQTASASLAMEVAGGGGVAGVDYDQLIVRDVASFQGPIDVTLLSDFTPAKDDSFELIRYGSLQFGTPGVPPPLNLPQLTGELFWSSNFGPQALTITVVPEPPSFPILALCGLTLCVVWRLRRKASLASAVVGLLAVLCPPTLLAESITVEQGAQVTRPTAVTVNAGEAITVRDASRLDLQNSLTVDGGTVRVESQGRFNTATLAGQTVLKGGNAHATVDGGSIWNVGGPFVIGETGDAHLTISGGGHVHSGFNGSLTEISTRFDAGDSMGTALVTGAGSLWDVRGGLRMGRGTFSIFDGGAVSVDSYVEFSRPLRRGPIEVNVSGPGSTWTIREYVDMIETDHDIILSDQAQIRSGTSGGRTHFSGLRSGPPGSAVVTGIGTRWQMGGGFWPQRTNVLVTDGASIVASGWADINAATLSIRAGATVSFGDYMTVGGDSRSTLDVSGPLSRLTVTNELSTGVFSTTESHLNITNGATVRSGYGRISTPTGAARSSATVSGAGSIWTNTLGDLTLSNADLFIRDSGKVEVLGRLSSNGSASLNIANGGILITGEPIAGTVTINLTNGQIGPSGTNTNGEIRGSGLIVGNVTARNKVTVGNSAGLLTIQGGYEQTSLASLAMELGGPGGVVGTDYDQLVVRDLARLFGPIDVALINNYTPTKGDSFDLIRYGSVQFDSRTGPPPLNLPSLTGDLFWSSNFGPQALTITVVPEPSSFALTALGALALLAAFRLRHSAAHTPAKRHSTSRNLIAILFAAAASLLTVSRANAEIHFLHVPSDSAPVYPQRPIVVDGTTIYGWGRDSQARGLLYRINTDGSGLQVLKHLSFEPPSGFVLNGSTLYAGAGSFSGGYVFKINTDGTDESAIHAFSSLLRPDEGLQPTTTMTLADGTLYGLAEFGGTDNAGTLFKLNLDGSGFQTLHRFEERSLALNNIMGPTLAVSGSTVFGITHGSSNRSATLYRIGADGTDFQVLHTFTGNRGLGPTPGLHIVDSVLYGAVSAENTPGGYIQGSIYRINTDGTDFQAIRPLNGSASFLQLDGSTFYGIASSAAGVDAFGMNIDGSDYQVLHHFTSGDLPVSFVKSGPMLYGVTSRESEIFAIPIPEPSTWVLAAFALVGLALALRRSQLTLRLMNRTTVIALALVAILSLITAAARADLTFDLRAVSGSQIIIHGPKSVAITQNSVGGWIDFELYAFVNGFNVTANDESIHSFLGNMLSTHIGSGAVGGSMVNAGETATRVRRGIVHPMDHFGSSDGWLQNLDDDPDLEIGGTGWQIVEGQGRRETSNGMIAGRGDPFRVRNYEGQAAVAEFLLYRFSLGIESFLAETSTDTTAIAFNNGTLAPFGMWFEDGETRTNRHGRNDRIVFGESVLIRAAQTPEELALIPEPGTLALALAGLLGIGWIVARRNE